MNVLISLTTESLRWCVGEGTRTSEKYAGRPGHYRTGNKTSFHIIAKLGECAVEDWLYRSAPDSKVDSAFRNIERDKEADILADDIRIEVKTWNYGTWKKGGRCISPKQAPYLREKSDVIVWCRLSRHVPNTQPASLQGICVEVMGWSRVEEVLNCKPINTSFDSEIRLNHQVSEDDLRGMSELLGLLRNEGGVAS